MDARPRKGLGLLLGWAFSSIMALALLVGAFVAYGLIKAGYEQQLERRLKAYAATSASGMGGRALAHLETNTSTDDELYVLYRDRLRALQEHAGVRRAAVLDSDGILVVDSHGSAPGGPDQGFRADLPELQASFEQGPVVTIQYRDADGRVWRNGFAPVQHRDGTNTRFAVAVELEADYLDQLRYVRWTMAATVLGVFIVTLGAAALLSRAWKGLLDDLARQTRLAEQAQFSAGMAHQIKNPLAALRGYVELLARTLQDPMQKQIADKLVSEVGALDRVVRDFLQFSRGAHGSIETLKLATALHPVLESARNAGGDGVTVHAADVPEIDVEVDSTALREALTNVAVNAAEALREDGGELHVSARVAGKTVTIEFRDTGPGIADDVRERLFEPFVTGKADGTGLGLPIARRLLRDLGGDLELVQTGGSGTTFRATFTRESIEDTRRIRAQTKRLKQRAQQK